MKNDVLNSFDMSALPIAALILFLILFLSVFFWSYTKRSKEIYRHVANMPLEDAQLKEED